MITINGLEEKEARILFEELKKYKSYLNSYIRSHMLGDLYFTEDVKSIEYIDFDQSDIELYGEDIITEFFLMYGKEEKDCDNTNEVSYVYKIGEYNYVFGMDCQYDDCVYDKQLHCWFN